jgi:hypothetical protein
LCGKVNFLKVCPQIRILLENLGETGVSSEVRYGTFIIVIGGCERPFFGRGSFWFFVLIVLIDVRLEAWDRATAYGQYSERGWGEEY